MQRSAFAALLLPTLAACPTDLDSERPRGDQAAIASAEQAVLLNEADPAARVVVASEYRKADRLFEAAEQLKKSVELDPGNGRARVELASVYEALGIYTAAFRQLRDCLEADPSQPDCLHAVGGLLKADGSQTGLDQAKRAWDRFLLVAPDDPRAEEIRDGLNQIEAQLSKSRPAAPASQPAAEIPEHDQEGDQDVGELNAFGAQISAAIQAIRQRDLPKAESAFRKALEIRPDDPAALAGLADTVFHQGKENEAIKLAERAYELGPTLPQSRWIYGYVLLKTRRRMEEGLSAWRDLARDDPEYAERLGVTKTLEQVNRIAPTPQ